MKIGIVGAGMIGGALAHRLVAAGYDVVLANRRGPATLAPLLDDLGPKATATTAEAIAAAGDLLVLAVPFGATRDLVLGPVGGKVVVDAGNHYEGRDGRIAALEDGSTTSAELTALALPGARVVKAFNTLYWSVLRDGGRPPGDPQRLAIPLAGDDPDAKSQVATLIDAIGFDPLDTGPLAEGGRLQEPTGPLFNRPLTLPQATPLIP